MILALAIGGILAGCTNTEAPTAVISGAPEPLTRDVFFDVPRRGPVPLKVAGKLPSVINESSGLAQASESGVFWTQNDSGDRARVFAIDAYGKLVGQAGKSGVVITNARNVDWEDLAEDFRGNLLIGAFGNNNNHRRDLSIYQVPMPDPATATTADATARWIFHFPDQKEFPPEEKNYDCEAMFVAQGKIYLLTKHRDDTMTTLYRLDSRDETESNALTLLAQGNLRGMVTGAASWNDGQRVAVLSYSGVWVFTPPTSDGARIFEGAVSWMPIRAGQAEAVAFLDADTLIITNEQREVFHVQISEMSTVSRRD
ncbi:hypothetical protein GCM10007047_30920 [Cerasicoccus arenae]|uniref:Uncharacterized protein n=2 Tax=Cerasicoccus arenae TaxID=424488 RepID=A0A8J3DEV8_9BACT|nr:hypothetical protein GCM10007047_30920 [Cerasicoccus arenae]